MSDPATAPADMAAHLGAFAAQLRARHGFRIGPAELRDALRALRAVDLGQRREVRDALRAVLCADPVQVRVFGAEFDRYFAAGRHSPALPPPLLPPAPGGQADPAPPADRPNDPASPGQRPTERPDPPLPGPEGDLPPDLDQIQGHAHTAERPATDPSDSGLILRSRQSPAAGAGDTDRPSSGDLPELLRAASALIAALRLARPRRRVPRPHGRSLDPRRTLRAAARTAGDPLRLHWLGHPRREARFLVVLDGSRSMGQDAARLLRFAQALHLRTRQVEVYSFSTALVRLTPLLRRTRPGEALPLPADAGGWGGGTRIGEALLRLSRDERARITPQTAVLILSDGLDTGDPALVTRALRDLSARAGLVVWLSPLAGHPEYRPVQRAIQAALPYLDALLPAGSLSDLLALPARLRGDRALAGRSGRR